MAILVGVNEHILMVKQRVKKKYIKKSKQIFLLKKMFLKRKYGLKKKITILKPLLLFITLKKNNIFCTLQKLCPSKTIYKATSGKLNMKITSKRLRWNLKLFLSSFFFKSNFLLTKRLFSYNCFIVHVISPLKFRKQIVEYFLNLKPRLFSNLILDIHTSKPYNGCRSLKMIRKKRKRVLVK